MKKELFVFDDGFRLDANQLLVRISSSVKSKNELLLLFAKGLRFPDYFGMNWDAFEECLRDLSWVKENQIVLMHDGIPMDSDLSSQKVYLDILHGAIENWKDRDVHKLLVVFPLGLKPHVQSLMASR